MNAAIANSTIPSPSGAKLMVKTDFTTPDIITRVNECFRLFNNQAAKLAPSFAGATVELTCYNVWKFIKNNIRYQVDAGGNQYVQTPAALWNSKVGDCKSFSVFAASILHNLGIDGRLRFVSYGGSKIPKHVYVVIPVKTGIITVDPTPLPNGKVYWNTEYGPKHIYDYSMSEVAIIAGVPAMKRKRMMQVRRPKVNGMYSIGACGDDTADGCYAQDMEEPVKDVNPPDPPKENKKFPWLLIVAGLAAIKILS